MPEGGADFLRSGLERLCKAFDFVCGKVDCTSNSGAEALGDALSCLKAVGHCLLECVAKAFRLLGGFPDLCPEGIGIIAGIVQAVAELSRCLLRCAGCVADVLRGCCGVVCCIGEGSGAVPGGCAGGNCSGAELLCAHFDGPELLLQLVNLLG